MKIQFQSDFFPSWISSAFHLTLIRCLSSRFGNFTRIWPHWTFFFSLQIAEKCREAKVKGYICLYKIYSYAAAAKQQLCFSCVWLCDPIDGSPPGSAVPGILQAGTLEWVAISFSHVGLLSHQTSLELSEPFYNYFIYYFGHAMQHMGS